MLLYSHNSKRINFLNINEGPNSGASELISRFTIIVSVWTQFSEQSMVCHETTPCLIIRVVIIFPLILTLRDIIICIHTISPSSIESAMQLLMQELRQNM